MEENNNQRITLSLPSRLDLLSVVDKVVEGVTATMKFAEDDRDAVAISVIEASSNAIQHGNAENADKSFEVIFDLNGDSLTVTIHDQGAGFNPAEKGAKEAPDLHQERGRGIFIMRSMMDDVTFDFSNGTYVQLIKRRSPGEPGEDA